MKKRRIDEKVLLSCIQELVTCPSPSSYTLSSKNIIDICQKLKVKNTEQNRKRIQTLLFRKAKSALIVRPLRRPRKINSSEFQVAFKNRRSQTEKNVRRRLQNKQRIFSRKISDHKSSERIHHERRRKVGTFIDNKNANIKATSRTHKIISSRIRVDLAKKKFHRGKGDYQDSDNDGDRGTDGHSSDDEDHGGDFSTSDQCCEDKYDVHDGIYDYNDDDNIDDADDCDIDNDGDNVVDDNDDDDDEGKVDDKDYDDNKEDVTDVDTDDDKDDDNDDDDDVDQEDVDDKDYANDGDEVDDDDDEDDDDAENEDGDEDDDDEDNVDNKDCEDIDDVNDVVNNEVKEDVDDDEDEDDEDNVDNKDCDDIDDVNDVVNNDVKEDVDDDDDNDWDGACSDNGGCVDKTYDNAKDDKNDDDEEDVNQIDTGIGDSDDIRCEERDDASADRGQDSDNEVVSKDEDGEHCDGKGSNGFIGERGVASGECQHNGGRKRYADRQGDVYTDGNCGGFDRKEGGEFNEGERGDDTLGKVGSSNGCVEGNDDRYDVGADGDGDNDVDGNIDVDGVSNMDDGEDDDDVKVDEDYVPHETDTDSIDDAADDDDDDHDDEEHTTEEYENLEKEDSYLRKETITYPRDFEFYLSSLEYVTIQPIESEGRRKLQKGWTDLFYEKFKEHNPACVLRFTRNLVAKRESRKTRCDFFTGKATCTFVGCAKYEFHISKEPSPNLSKIAVVVHRLGDISHKKEIRKRKLQGNKRKDVKKALLTQGVSNFFYEKMGQMTTDELDNGNRTDCQTKQVLQKAVYEARKEVLLHEDTFKEIVLTQELFFDEDTSSDKIRGYIQTICYDPFMVIMFTQAQFEILVSRLKSGKCYLYFDATGSVISKLGTPKKRVLYYALVIRSDIVNDPPLPVAEMFTNDNATPAISHFLHTIRHNIVKHFGVRTVPTKIETDFSWPLIYASLLIFNREDLPVYLSRAWNITTRKYKEPVMAKFTIVHLCASHMIKKMKSQLSAKEPNKDLVEFITRVFAVMQNGNELEYIFKIWKSLTIVLLSKTLCNEVDEHLLFLQKEMEKIDHAGIEIIEDELNAEEVDCCIITDERPMRNTSPFYKKAIERHFALYDNGITWNSYYSPRSYDFILNNYMYLLPLWTGLLLGDLERYTKDIITTEKQESRDTNACVENWFKIVKQDTLQKQKRLRPGVFVRKIHKTLKGRVNEFRAGSKLPSYRKRKHCRDPDTEKELWNKRERKTSVPKYFSSPKTPISVKKKIPANPVQNRQHMQSPYQQAAPPLNGNGLNNDLLNCWLNAAIQIIRSIPLMTNKLKDCSDPLVVEVCDIICRLERGDGHVSVDVLLGLLASDTSMAIDVGEQEDPCQFLLTFLNRIPAGNDPVIIKTTLKCFRCKQKRDLYEEHIIWSVDFSSSSTSILECLKETIKTESLIEEQAVVVKTHLTKGSSTCRVLQLKRFTNFQKKINTRVKINEIMRPRSLNGGNKMENDSMIEEAEMFHLKSVMCHSGRSINSGHYWTAVKENGKTVTYDDALTSVKRPDFMYSHIVEVGFLQKNILDVKA